MDYNNKFGAIEYMNNTFSTTYSKFPPVQQQQQKPSKKESHNRPSNTVIKSSSVYQIQESVVHSLPFRPHPQNDNESSINDNFDVSEKNDKLIPSEAYMRFASIPSVKIKESKPILIVLDLNGTLLHRTKTRKSHILRPYIQRFINYIFNNGFTIMVWSSAQPFNVRRMVTAAFGDYENDLIDVWDRDSFGLSMEKYHKKSITIKDLDKVWTKLNNNTRNTSLWGQSNTVLIDDSEIKTQLQPFNSIHLVEFDGDRAVAGDDRELYDVIPYLDNLRYQSNVSNYIKEFPHKDTKLNVKETNHLYYNGDSSSYKTNNLYYNDNSSSYKAITTLNSAVKKDESLSISSLVNNMMYRMKNEDNRVIPPCNMQRKQTQSNDKYKVF